MQRAWNGPLGRAGYSLKKKGLKLRPSVRLFADWVPAIP